MTQRPDAVAEVSIDLWQRLAAELVSIIGEGGFQSLFSRSAQLTGASFPWIGPVDAGQKIDATFPDLKTRLAAHDYPEAGEASVGLLVTFSDILAVLIGDILTNNILTAAWGADAPDASDKEVL